MLPYLQGKLRSSNIAVTHACVTRFLNEKWLRENFLLKKNTISTPEAHTRFGLIFYVYNMSMKNFTFNAKVWKYQSTAAWYFLNLDKSISTKIRKLKKSKAMGMVPVKAKAKDFEWKTSLFWSKKDENYMLPLKKKVRYEVGILEGDTVTVSLEI